MKSNISRYSDLSPVHNNGLTNHVPMFVYALEYLGMNETSIIKVAEKYVAERNIEKAGSKKVKIKNINDFLGSNEHYLDYIEFFKCEIKSFGREETIRKYIDLLLEGSSGGSFHGLIRLAYAIESKEEGELERALAYMSNSYQKFEIDLDEIPVKEPFETFIFLSRNQHFKEKHYKKRLISDKMMEVASDSEAKELLGNLGEEYLDIKSLEKIAVKLYAMTYNFTVLHAFTSTHALSILMPYISDFKRIIALHWIHIQLAYLSTNCTKVNEIKIDDNITWNEIFKGAICSDDIHTYKLIYSLHKSYLKYKEEQWSNIYISCSKKHLNL